MASQMLSEDSKQTRNGFSQTEPFIDQNNNDQQYMNKIMKQQLIIEDYIDKLAAADFQQKQFTEEISEIKSLHQEELAQLQKHFQKDEISRPSIQKENVVCQTENIPSQEVRHYRKKARQLEIAFDQASKKIVRMRTEISSKRDENRILQKTNSVLENELSKRLQPQENPRINEFKEELQKEIKNLRATESNVRKRLHESEITSATVVNFIRKEIKCAPKNFRRHYIFFLKFIVG